MFFFTKWGKNMHLTPFFHQLSIIFSPTCSEKYSPLNLRFQINPFTFQSKQWVCWPPGWARASPSPSRICPSAGVASDRSLQTHYPKTKGRIRKNYIGSLKSNK